MTRENFVKRRLWQFFIAFSVVLLVLVREVVVGALASRTMAVIVSSFAVVGWIFLWASFAKAARSNEFAESKKLTVAGRKRLVWHIRSNKILIGIMGLSLIVGLIVTRGEPILPRIAGALGNIAITTLYVKALRAKQLKLRQLDSQIISSTGTDKQ